MYDDRMKYSSRSVIELTRRLVDRFGPRPPGSDASRQCADALADEARPHADSVELQDFKVSPLAFLGWIRVLVSAYILAVGCLWLGWYGIAVMLMTAAVGLLILQFFLYREVLDPFYPKSTGRNVLASLEPGGDVKGELFISGHHDSARIFNFFIHQPALYSLRVNGGIGSLLLLFFVSIVMALIDGPGGSPAWSRGVAVVFTVLLVFDGPLWFFASKKNTPGAGDNLASTAVAWEFLKACAEEKKAGRGFEHLRITAVSWDAEEAGLRGSRAWRKSRRKDPIPHPAWNLNLECLYDPQEMFLLTTDINGSVDLSVSLAQKCSRILSEKTDYGAPCKPVAFLTGGTDAGETARAGVQATTLMGMPWANDARASVYHTPKDDVESVNADAVEASLRLAEALAAELDGELAGS